MSFRTTAALFGILIAVLMLFGLMLARQRSQLDPGFVIPTLAKEKDVAIGTVEVGGEGKTYVFFKSGSGWRLRLPSSKVDVRADDAKVRELIDQVRQARKSDEADITRNLAQWGLENPLGRITLKTASGDKEWTLFLGRTSPDKAYVYVNSSDRPRDVLAVRRKQLDSALITPETITKYRSTRLLDGIFTTTALKLTQPGEKDGPVLALEKNAQGAWWFKTPAYGPAESSGSAEARAADPKSIVGVQGLLSALDAIRVESDKDFETPGKNVFPESKALLRVEVQHAEEGGKARPPEVLLVGDKVGGKSEEYYARLASDDAVVRVAARNVEAVLEVLKKPDSLRSRDVAQIEPNRPDVVRVSRGAKLADVTTLFRARGDEWKVVAGSLRHRANEQAIQGADGLLTAVQGKGKVLTFIDVSDAKQGAAKDKELGLDAPVAEVAIWIDGLDTDTPKKEEKKDDKAKKDDKKEKKDDKAKKEDKKEEKKDEEPRLKAGAKPALKLTFARKDDKKDTTVYVKRETADGIISRVSVPASVLDKLLPAEGPLAYLATNLATFRAADVMKLELKLPGRTFVAMREQPKKDEKKDGKKDDKKDDKKGEKKVEKKDEGKEPPPKGWLLVEPASFKDRPYAD